MEVDGGHLTGSGLSSVVPENTKNFPKSIRAKADGPGSREPEVLQCPEPRKQKGNNFQL